jgi:hypothetical protein
LSQAGYGKGPIVGGELTDYWYPVV